jgi:hypothetical protein
MVNIENLFLFVLKATKKNDIDEVLNDPKFNEFKSHIDSLIDLESVLNKKYKKGSDVARDVKKLLNNTHAFSGGFVPKSMIGTFYKTFDLEEFFKLLKKTNTIDDIRYLLEIAVEHGFKNKKSSTPNYNQAAIFVSAWLAAAQPSKFIAWRLGRWNHFSQVLDLNTHQKRSKEKAECIYESSVYANDLLQNLSASYKRHGLRLVSGLIAYASYYSSKSIYNFLSEPQSEGNDSLKLTVTPPGKLKFKPGHKELTEKSSQSSGKTTLTSVTHLHNKIQNKLYAKLCSEFGKDKVGTEISPGDQTRIDVVLKKSASSHDIYEIKVGFTTRQVIRDALGQLLEYKYYHKNRLAIDRIVVVSNLELNEPCSAWLKELNKLGLKLDYLCID